MERGNERQMLNDQTSAGNPVTGRTWPDLIASPPIWVGMVILGVIGTLAASLALDKPLIQYGELTIGAPASQGTVPTTTDSLPTGAVVAFDQPGGCPKGWVDIGEKWPGRVLVAAISNTESPYGFGKDGGKERVSLEASNLPSHRHTGTTANAKIVGDFAITPEPGNLSAQNHAVGFKNESPTTRYNNYDDRTDNNADFPMRAHIHSFTAESTDDQIGKAHENMPPFIALYFCKKEVG